MAYSRESHELIEATLKSMIKEYGGNLAYAKMVGYLMVNVPLEDAKRIAKHESDKAVA
tara:strand:+ start:354 stop:527 length:174 start_codon:yes stop_codon:yes gene_type:complete